MAIVKGRSRGNGAQLGNYLEHGEENENVVVLDIKGTAHPRDLKKSLLEMSLTSELTKGKHGLYHVQFSPEMGFDRKMPPRSWIRAAQIIEKYLNLTGQKRAIVLHEKESRIHGHMVWERYNHATGKLIDMSQSYKKHDKARAEIEKELGHNRTYQHSEASSHRKASRVQEKKDHKKTLTEIWHKTKDGASFVKEAEKAGYKIAKGEERRPWRVITPDGKDENLVRYLEKDIKTKQVSGRLNPIRKELKTVDQALNPSRKSEKAGEKETNAVGQKEVLARQAAQNFYDVKTPAQPQNNQSLPEIMKSFKHNLGDNDLGYTVGQKLQEERTENQRDMMERERDMQDEMLRQIRQNMGGY